MPTFSMGLKTILPVIKQAKNQKKTIVLATGVFDIIHQEHVKFLTKAKAAGDLLIVGLETDKRVAEMKGEGRPVNSLITRIKNLQALCLADHVFSLPEQFNRQADWESFVQNLSPDIYAVSSHTNWLENKRTIMEKFGGQLVIVHQHNPKVSTTILIDSKKKNAV